MMATSWGNNFLQVKMKTWILGLKTNGNKWWKNDSIFNKTDKFHIFPYFYSHFLCISMTTEDDDVTHDDESDYVTILYYNANKIMTDCWMNLDMYINTMFPLLFYPHQDRLIIIYNVNVRNIWWANIYKINRIITICTMNTKFLKGTKWTIICSETNIFFFKNKKLKKNNK